jgi:hypothetical protein
MGRTTAPTSELAARAEAAKMVFKDIIGIGVEGRYNINDRTELGWVQEAMQKNVKRVKAAVA